MLPTVLAKAYPRGATLPAFPSPVEPCVNASSLHISSTFDSGAVEVLSLADHADIRLRIRPDTASPSPSGSISVSKAPAACPAS